MQTRDQANELPWDEVDDDEEAVSVGQVGRAVVTATDWTTETVLSQLRRGNIQLNPKFQRRDAWDPIRKSRFIESLILGLPIPQLVLAEDMSRRGKFIVLDGKQRLLTLRQFAEGSSVGGGDEFEKLSLRGLDVRTDLRGMTLKKMEDNSGNEDDVNALLNQTIRTVVVRQWPSEDFLNLVFLRLNTGSVQLSPQELRQALHPGGFSDFLDDYSADSSGIQRALRITKPDFRMRDVETLLRYYAFHYNLGDYRGNLRQFLDDTVADLNTRWPSASNDVLRVAGYCEAAIDTTFEIFGKDAFYRWSGNKYERRFNRAVFDIMTYYFSNEETAQEAIERRVDVVVRFKGLCSLDSDFRAFIQTTTKTPQATFGRLEIWARGLEEVGVHVRTPPR